MLNNLIDRIKLPFRKEKELYLALNDILGFYPHNITYYKVALMHKSLGHRATEEELRVLEGKKGNKKKEDKYAIFHRNKGAKARRDDKYGKRQGRRGQLGKQLNNERLEFLGDAILDAVVGDVVYNRFPGKPEGFLTNTRSKLVQRETLGRLAKEMGIGKLILASGRNSTHNSYIGGNAFEALVGAVYLDRGYEACQAFWTERIMKKYLDVEKMAYKEVNFKSKILEWAQKNRVRIDFRLEDQSLDKQGSPKFVYTLFIEGVKGNTGEGFSKKESQQKACETTLRRLRNDKEFLDSVFAAKTERTKMEENPTTVVPEVETQSTEDAFTMPHGRDSRDNSAADVVYDTPVMPTKAENEVDSLSLDDIDTSLKEKTREEIIAEAESMAYEK